MAFKRRIVGASKVLALSGALLATFFVFFGVAMRVAIKTREVTVPDLKGLTVAEANARVADVGLVLKVEELRKIDPQVPAGRVMLQEPASGLTTRSQRSVKAWISGGPRLMKVPALVGETERAAEARLHQEAFELAGTAEIRSSQYPVGAVVAQEPPAASSGTRVALLVNRGEAGTTYVMPDLIGVDGERAADILRARGFRAAVVGYAPYPGVPAGIVLRQYPRAGFQIGPGEPVSLEVSR